MRNEYMINKINCKCCNNEIAKEEVVYCETCNTAFCKECNSKKDVVSYGSCTYCRW